MAFWSLPWIYEKMDSKWLQNEAVSPWDLTKDDRGSCRQWSHPLSQQLAETKTKQTLQRSSQLREASESPFHVTKPCHFLNSDSKVSASQKMSPSEKRAWEMDREEKLSKGEKMTDITKQPKVTVSMDSLWLSSRAKPSLVGSPLSCSRYRVSWERKAGYVHLACRMTKIKTQQPTVKILGFPGLLPPQETSGRWHCALSQRSHCCGPSETPPSQLWICQADQRHSRNNHLSEGWQLSNGKREREEKESEFQTIGRSTASVKFTSYHGLNDFPIHL